MNPKGETPEGETGEFVEHESSASNAESSEMPKEIGGPKGPEPTRYGDWERNGRCSDF